MVFSSATFLFFFLPVTLLLTGVVSRSGKNLALLMASLFFYFWGEGLFGLLLVASIGVNAILGRLLDRDIPGRKMFLILGIVLNLLPLFVLKYSSFFYSTLTSFTGFSPLSADGLNSLYLPAGISFYTFQAISYLVDVYRKIVPAERKMVNSGLYIALFPQLIAGPIVRYHDIAAQLKKREVTRKNFAAGIERFVFGLGKKTLIADPLGEMADRIFSMPVTDLSSPQAWLGALSFALQIYYDFSGYSDMAIGLAHLFGFKLPENFNYPYISRSIKDFWRRWHISLSSWLRDYLYIPLGGNRKGPVRTSVNLFVVFLLCGLWHGANWTFAVWGLWHGFFLVIERITPFKTNRFLQPAGFIYTFFVVLIGWVIFRSSSLAAAWDFLQVMGDWQGAFLAEFYSLVAADRKFNFIMVIAVLLSAPVFPAVKEKTKKLLSFDYTPMVNNAILAGTNLLRVSLFGTVFYFSLLTIASHAYSPFLYFQF